MKKITVTYKIRQDGIVEEKVDGVVGGECERVTESIENKLGDLTRRLHTSEAYLTEQTNVTDVTLQHNQD
tara:strand:+ start:1670 stop:1879 length:210 start_codon:yes stop_codon:yes gene_type:complete